MPVGIVVQSDAGTVADANAYLAVAAFKAYCILRGYDISAYSDDQLAVALIRATDYIDNRFRFRGTRLTGVAQTTQFPRADIVDREGNAVTGLPNALKNATAEYGFRAIPAPLLKDTLQPEGGHILKSTTDKVDVIETTVVYDNIPGYTIIPEYPTADNFLRAAGLIAERFGIPLVR